MHSMNTLRNLAWGVSSLGLGQTAILVLLPWLVELTPASYAQWAQFFAAGMGCYLIGSLVWPLLLSRWGHRTLLHLGLLGFALSMILMAACCQLWQLGLVSESNCLTGLLMSRLCYGLCASALMPITQSWAGELSSAKERLSAFSAISLQFSLGRMLGPIIAIVSLWIHPIAPLIVLSSWPFIVIALIKSVPDVRVAHQPNNNTGVKQIIANLKPPVALAVMAMSTTAVASTLQFQASPVLAHILQTTPNSTSGTLAVLLTLAALVSAFAHRMQLRHPPRSVRGRILFVCALILLSSLGVGITVWLQTIWLFFFAIMVLTAGIALLTPLYSSQLSLQNSHQSIVATQLSILHILGHWIGLSVTGFFLEMNLLLVPLWLSTLGILMILAGSMTNIKHADHSHLSTSQS